MRRFVLLNFLTALCLSSIATERSSAQQTTGSLEARIVDVNGEPVVSATVTITSSDSRTRTATSNPQGHVRLPALPVGTYSVEITHVRHSTVTYEDVTIQLGKSTSLGDIQLADSSTEVVVVTGKRSIIDMRSTELGANLDAGTLERLPTQRDYRDIISYLPQSNASFLGDGTNIAGSTGSENAFFVEGVNVTDPFLASTGMRLPQNFIREIEVKTGGYQAEYGQSVGGIINVITHTGTNELRGQVFGYFTNNNFGSDSRRGSLELRQDSFDRYDAGVSLGGPILRDKLWFFGAYNPTFEIENVEIPGFGLFEDKRTTHQFAGKLTWQVDSSTLLNVSGFGDPTDHDQVGPNLFGDSPTSVSNPDPLLGKLTQGGYAIAIDGRHLANDNVLFEAQLSYFDFRNKATGATDVGRNEPLYADFVTGDWSGGYGNIFDHHNVRWTGALSATYYKDRHEFKAGVQYEDILLDESWTWLAADGRDGMVWRIGDTGVADWFSSRVFNVFDLHHRLPSIYLQDSWSATNRLRINAGLRWDGQYFVGSGNGISKDIWDQYQPRVGFTYEIGATRSQKVFGSYGRFYQQIPTIASSFYIGDFFQYLVFYDENPFPDFNVPVNGDTFFVTVPETARITKESIKGQHFDEVTLGYERRLKTNWKFGIRGIHRKLRQAVEDVVTEFPVFTWGNPGRGELGFLPRPKRNYSALELTLDRVYDGNYEIFASYVLSRNFGNAPGVFDTDGDNPNANVTSQYWSPEQLVNAEGRLPNDRPHNFKIYGAKTFGFGLTTGAFFTAQSGTPLNEFGGTTIGPRAFSHLVPRGTAGRTPWIWDLNLRLAYDLSRLTGPTNRVRPRLLVDVFHLFGQREATDIDQVHYFSLDENGNQDGLNPQFGQPIAWQPPMTIRMGIEASF